MSVALVDIAGPVLPGLQEIYNTITNSVPGSRMVAFGGRLPEGDEDIWQIIAFLKSGVSGC